MDNAISVPAKRVTRAAWLTLLVFVASLVLLVGNALAAPVLMDLGNRLAIGDSYSGCGCPMLEGKPMSREYELRLSRLGPATLCHPHYGE